MIWRRLAASTSIMAIMAYASAAQAQANPAVMNRAEAPVGPTPAAQPAAAEPAQVAEVIVTATKRETSLEKTPIAISAFNQKQLDQNQIKDLTQLAQYVPSLAFSQSGLRDAVTLTLRGIGNDTSLSVLSDPEVAVYIDGIYSPRPQGADVLAYDLERLDVLRGPQGTLFGRNSTAGAVQFDTAKPTFDGLHAYAEALGGSYGRFGTQGMINIPLSDTLSVRAAFITDKNDGYVSYQNPPNIAGIDRSAFITNGSKYYAMDDKSARLSVAWKPTSRFRWDINGEYFSDDGTPIIPLLETARAGQSFWSTLSDTAPYQARSADSIRSNMSYDLTRDVQVAYVAGWNLVGGPVQSDADAGAYPPDPSDPNNLPNGAFEEDRTVYEHDSFWSQELQLKSTGTHRFDWIIGGFYSHESNRIRYDYDIRNGYRDGTFNVASAQVTPDDQVRSVAGFGQAVFHVTPFLNLTGGIRYTDDDKRSDTVNVNGFSETCAANDTAADGTCAGLFGIGYGDTAQQLAAETGFKAKSLANHGNWDKITWLARADANLTRTTLGYVSVSTGFKSGVLVGATRLASPETLTNYEVGLKQRLFDGRVTFNAAAYYIDFKDYQVTLIVPTYNTENQIISSLSTTSNAQGATAEGFEAELAANITPVDRLSMNADIQHTRLETLLDVDTRVYDPGITADVENLKGNELPHAPLFSITGTYVHDFNLPNGGIVSPRATLHYETSSWLSFFNGDKPSNFLNPTGVSFYGVDWDKQDQYAKLDLGLTYTSPDRRYIVEVFGKNVTSTLVRTGAYPYINLINSPAFLAEYAPPATWGARVRVTF